ncbi:amidase [Nocardia sp. NPDC060256]|uniref:amidase n=1 Tax=unclassified Nocardia TaxID=2637762 RepID=UPI0036632C16
MTGGDPCEPTTLSAFALAEAIRERRLSAHDVVEAHIEVLERAQPRTNAVAANRFEQARAEAHAADRLVAAESAVLPALLGVPCTVKEMIGIAGMPHTAGFVRRQGKTAVRTASAAQRLIDAGAIVLAQTNVSELGIWIESVNRIYGRTSNAHDRRRTAGGSSGGEAVAVAVGGATFGLGSDMGGSIRIPAYFNGVFGHKPTAGLVPNTGMFPDTVGEIGRLLSIGPMARRASDLMPLLEIISGPDGTDSFTRAVTLGDPETVDLQGLPVIISEQTTLIPARQEVRGARDRAAAELARHGADVRRVPLRGMRRATEFFLTAAAEFGGSLGAIIAAEAGAEPVETLVRQAMSHNGMTTLTLIGERIPRPERAVRRSLAAARALSAEVDTIIGSGVMLHTPFRSTAPRHRATFAQPWLQTPCSVFNVLGLPVTQVPLGLSSAGLPLGVQVAAGRDRDHVAIAVALALERAFGGWRPPVAR